MKRIFLLTTLLILILPCIVGAATYYASPTGSGTDCSIGVPCALYYAVETKAAAGDTIIVNDGTYTGSDDLGSNTQIDVSDNNLTIQADNAGQAIIDGDGLYPTGGYSTGNGALIVINTGVTGVTIDGLVLRRSTAKGIYLFADANDSTVKNCTIYQCHRAALVIFNADDVLVEDCEIYQNCMCVGGGYSEGQPVCTGGDIPSQVTTPRAKRATFRRCIVRDSYNEGLNIERYSEDITVEYCMIYGNYKLQLYAVNTINPIIRYNLIYGTNTNANGWTGTGPGIWFGNEAQWAQPNVYMNAKVYGNLVANTSNNMWIGGGAAVKIHNVFMYNNTLIEGVSYGFRVEGATGSGHIFKNNIIWQTDDVIAFVPAGLVTGDYNLWSREPDADIQGANDPTYAVPLTSKVAGWDSLSGGDLDGTEFLLQSSSTAIDAGLDLGSEYVNAITVGTAYTASPITVVTDSQATHTPWEIGAWLYDSGEGPPPVAGDITFWWRCENVTLDGVLDFTAGDGVAAASGGSEAINTDAHYIGTNGLDAPAANSYYELDVVAGDIVNGTSDRIKFWLKKNTTTSHVRYFRIYQNDDNFIVLRNAAGWYDLTLYWRAGGVDQMFIATSDESTPLDEEWYYIEFAYDAGIGDGSDYAEIWVDGVSKVSISNETLTPITPVSMQMGIVGAFAADIHMDNIGVSSDKETDFFSIRNEDAYPTGTAGTPEFDAVGIATVTAGVATFYENPDTGTPATLDALESSTGFPGWFWAGRLTEQLGPSAEPEPSEFRWDCGPESTDYQDDPYYGDLPDAGGTYYMLWTPNLVAGNRAINPQAYGTTAADWLIMNDAVLEDGDGNALDLTFATVDIDGTGTITIGVPYPSTAPKEFTTTNTWAAAIAAGWYSVPDDNLDFDVTEDVDTDKPGTSGHEIVYTGEITGQVIVDEDYIKLERLIIN